MDATVTPIRSNAKSFAEIDHKGTWRVTWPCCNTEIYGTDDRDLFKAARNHPDVECGGEAPPRAVTSAPGGRGDHPAGTDLLPRSLDQS